MAVLICLIGFLLLLLFLAMGDEENKRFRIPAYPSIVEARIITITGILFSFFFFVFPDLLIYV